MQNYQQIVRRLISEGNEFDKADFKATYAVQEKVGKAGLAQLVSAIANTDREDLDNYGYVIIGAEKGKLIGGADFFSDDKQCSALTRGINAYLDPPVRFDVKGFHDEDVGWFGALVVQPRLSVTGPHFIGKEFNDGKFVIKPGQCYVRIGEETKLAQRSDFERMYQQKYSLEIERILDAKQEPRPELMLLWHSNGGTASGLVEPTLPLAAPVLRSLDEELTTIRRRKLPLPDSNEKPRPHAAHLGISGMAATMAALTGGRSKESIEEYNRELDSFCGQYARFRADLTEFNEVLSRCVKVTFVLRNSGRVPAKKAEFDLHLPQGVSARKNLPEMPKKPKEPNPFESALANVMGNFMRGTDLDYDRVNRLMADLPVNSPDYGPIIDGGRVEYGIDELKHGREYSFDPLYLLLPSAESDWDIPYTIHANNLPEPLTGTLRVTVQRTDMDEAQWTEHCAELLGR